MIPKRRKAASPAKPREKRPPKLDEATVKKAGLYYLERYAASANMLARVLLRRIERAERRGAEVNREQAEKAVRVVVQRFVEAGLVDDKVFTAAKVTSLRRRGESARAIRGKLNQKGVSADIVDQALEDHAETLAAERYDDDPDLDPDMEAALAYARRRRIGPYRLPEVRAEKRERDMAALARRGFSFDVCRTVVDMDESLV